ncbi:hypothetical protein L873DRAFT_1785732 [Choiromyces venosus 120613-1]|uniref:Uncharacterized protein n=1 Tax=Choiromyces venosus 120613-1 TaxID=1336337 RepID=A0A3N4K399_9PEZI|nr:hypothetical protein L873DRAFT_1785732 [Choiromyces venosus 120613-1]
MSTNSYPHNSHASRVVDRNRSEVSRNLKHLTFDWLLPVGVDHPSSRRSSTTTTNHQRRNQGRNTPRAAGKVYAQNPVGSNMGSPTSPTYSSETTISHHSQEWVYESDSSPPPISQRSTSGPNQAERRSLPMSVTAGAPTVIWICHNEDCRGEGPVGSVDLYPACLKCGHPRCPECEVHTIEPNGERRLDSAGPN